MKLDDIIPRVQEWIRQNQRRMQWYSISRPSTNDDICAHPLFKPLVLAEAVFNNNKALKNYWLKHLADHVDYKLLTYGQNDFDSAFNIYLAKHNLTHEHYWTGAGYGKLRLAAPYFQVLIKDQRINSFALYQFCTMYDTTRCRYLSGFVDSQNNVFKVFQRDNVPVMGGGTQTYSKIAFPALQHSIIQIKDRAATDLFLAHVLAPGSMLHNDFKDWATTYITETNDHHKLAEMLSCSSDSQSITKLMHMLTAADPNDITMLQLLDPSLDVLYQRIKHHQSIGNAISCIALPSL